MADATERASTYDEQPKRLKDRLFAPVPSPAVRRVEGADGIRRVYHGLDTSGFPSMRRVGETPTPYPPTNKEQTKRNLRLIK